jgi:N6-adenosine-specific RNA methylase IME4
MLTSESRIVVLARNERLDPSADLLHFAGNKRFSTILADPPWRFTNRTGKTAPEHRRLSRYSTLTLDEIVNLPVAAIATDTAHLYLWVPNSLLAEGLQVMSAWGTTVMS